MSFTDKDLTKLEGLLEMGATSITVKPNKIRSLLVRLKAAEKHINYITYYYGDTLTFQDEYKEWRAAAGK